MKKRFSILFVLLVLFSLLVGACATPAAPTQAPPPTEAPAAMPTEAPTMAPTEAPAEAPTEAATPLPAQEAGKLVLATTTSTQDSGLLDYLLPMFEQETGLKVDVIAVGTGQALKLGEDGNADVLLVHSRANEDKFMEAGHGTRRDDVMYNDFVIIGPENDPAGIKGTTSATDAFKKIAESQSPFISRGDESGTHNKELSIWKAAGIEPAGDWYISAGQGMGEVLTMADEQQAYTLSDRATYLARTKEGISLPILVEGDKVLFNPYGVIAVNPEKNPNIQAESATKFIEWLISVPVQEKIAEFGKEEFGQSLFTPDSKPWHEAQGSAAGAASGLKVTGKVTQEMAWSVDELKAMPTMDVEYTDKDGVKTTYNGVLISDLLTQAAPLPDATKLTFVGGDGYTAEAALADVTGCANCIVAILEDGSLQIVMPDFSGKMQVKGVVEIKVE